MCRADRLASLEARWFAASKLRPFGGDSLPSMQTTIAMTTPSLPAPVADFVDAVNRGDTDAFLAFFPDDGVVDDWGRRFVGHDAIRAWSDREFIGAEGTMTPQKVRVDGDEVDVRAGWASTHHNGDSRFVFALDGGRVREMRITSA